MSDKQYSERDIEALDESGGHYMRHVMAMTSEQLHSKSDIAAELAYRDHKIQSLEAELSEWRNASKAAEVTAIDLLKKENTELRRQIRALKQASIKQGNETLALKTENTELQQALEHQIGLADGEREKNAELRRMVERLRNALDGLLGQYFNLDQNLIDDGYIAEAIAASNESKEDRHG